MAASLKTIEKALSRSQTHYMAYLDLNNIRLQRHYRRLLSRMALMFMTCTFINDISGLFGTNVTNMFNDHDEGMGFSVIVSFDIVLVMAILLVARRWRIIGSRDLWTRDVDPTPRRTQWFGVDRIPGWLWYFGKRR